MEGTVINNASDTIQVYMQNTDNTANLNPELKNYQSGEIAVVGSGTAADTDVDGKGSYVYCAIWEVQTSSGTPDSWVIFRKSDKKVVGSHFGKFSVNVSGDVKDGWILTIADHKTSNKNILLIVIIAIAIFLILIGIGIGLYFAFRNKDGSTTSDTNPFGQTDMPIFVANY